MKPFMMHRAAGIPGTFVLLLSICAPAQAQQFISAKAATVQYVEGKVFLDDSPVRLQDGNYLSMKNGQTLRTQDGRAEILLTPFAYLWLDEYSVLHIRENRLIDVRLDLNWGSALIEIHKKLNTEPIRLNISNSFVEMKKKGLYRLDSAPGRIRVYGGDALARHEGKTARIKSGRTVLLGEKSASLKFDPEDADTLHRWAARRSLSLHTSSLFILKPRNVNELAWRPRPEGLYHPDYHLTLPYNNDWNRYWMGIWESIARQNEKRMRELRSDPRSIVIPQQDLIMRGDDTSNR